jgi:Ca2+-binding RTX toxin-like protein
VALGDLDGDGKLDLAVANYGSGTVSIRLGNGDGTFTAQPDVGAGPGAISLALGDLNGDSKLDIAVANSNSDTVTAMTAVTVSASSPSVAEGNGGTSTLAFTVALNAASSGTVTIDYATADGTATAGSDYTATSGTLTFAPGETSKTVNVSVLGDTIIEANETVLLNLSNTTHALLGTLQGTGTITNDDSAPLPGEDPPPANPFAGTPGPDSIQGAAAGETIRGQAGNDTIRGAAGPDIIYGNQDADLIYGNQGNDTVYGGQGADTAYGGQGADIVYGNLGADAIYGNLGNDTLYGGQDNDLLFGGQNDNLLVGGVGDDTLTGGIGADTYQFGANSGRDLVLGFSTGEGDKLDFGGQTFTTSDDGNGGTLFTLSGGGTVDLAGVAPGTVSPAFFA